MLPEKVARRGSRRSLPSPRHPWHDRNRWLRLKPAQLLDLAPRLARYILAAVPDWRVIVDAAGDGLRPELGISPSLWGEACRLLGREQAAVALAIVSTKATAHFNPRRGGVFCRHGAEG